MIKWLTKGSLEYRVETKEEADKLHREFESAANDNGFVLSGWTETLKEKKSKGEVLDSWYICSAKLTFNDAKEPESLWNDIEFTQKAYAQEQSDDIEDEVEEW